MLIHLYSNAVVNILHSSTQRCLPTISMKLLRPIYSISATSRHISLRRMLKYGWSSATLFSAHKQLAYLWHMTSNFQLIMKTYMYNSCFISSFHFNLSNLQHCDCGRERLQSNLFSVDSKVCILVECPSNNKQNLPESDLHII